MTSNSNISLPQEKKVPSTESQTAPVSTHCSPSSTHVPLANLDQTTMQRSPRQTVDLSDAEEYKELPGDDTGLLPATSARLSLLPKPLTIKARSREVVQASQSIEKPHDIAKDPLNDDSDNVSTIATIFEEKRNTIASWLEDILPSHETRSSTNTTQEQLSHSDSPSVRLAPTSPEPQKHLQFFDNFANLGYVSTKVGQSDHSTNTESDNEKNSKNLHAQNKMEESASSAEPAKLSATAMQQTQDNTTPSSINLHVQLHKTRSVSSYQISLISDIRPAVRYSNMISSDPSESHFTPPSGSEYQGVPAKSNAIPRSETDLTTETPANEKQASSNSKSESRSRSSTNGTESTSTPQPARRPSTSTSTKVSPRSLPLLPDIIKRSYIRVESFVKSHLLLVLMLYLLILLLWGIYFTFYKVYPGTLHIFCTRSLPTQSNAYPDHDCDIEACQKLFMWNWEKLNDAACLVW